MILYGVACVILMVVVIWFERKVSKEYDLDRVIREAEEFIKEKQDEQNK